MTLALSFQAVCYLRWGTSRQNPCLDLNVQLKNDSSQCAKHCFCLYARKRYEKLGFSRAVVVLQTSGVAKGFGAQVQE